MSKSDKTTSSEEEEVVLLQVDTGDIIKLKQILDETVANTFLCENTLEGHDPRAKNIGLTEDHKLNNIKLLLMITACLFACGAQFSPVPFPESRPILGFCCAIYFMLSGVLQFIQTFIDKDCILLTKAIKDGETSGDNLKKNPNLTKYGLRIRSIFPKFSEFYTVRIEYQGMEDSPFVKHTWSVGQFFDKEGMFDEYGLQYEVEALYRRFESGKFDKEDDGKAKKD
ncbi:signal peptidase complex subunit 2 [Chaetoceros tenuissimus]|uniref:Signal peptidase complex subunit 2 n=1 Tax=Chaetoceros tenuissimus TaxID=426638 RepID=A0AAD3H8Z9_9STRA|nr:signal peptidase complex subunit 2 [Chaetoceros tenuissimus]